LGIQGKLRIVFLPTPWFQIDAANPLGHLSMTMPNLNCFGHCFPPIDLDFDSARVRRYRLDRN
jgi:hypothetical protein